MQKFNNYDVISIKKFESIKKIFQSRESIFEEIYQTNRWNDSESRSGPGSNLKNTQLIRKEILKILKEYKINSILDVPCGDFNWMKEVKLDSISYIGADIVEGIILLNNKKYASKNKMFKKLDIVTDSLPTVDLILCRDLFIHLSINEIKNSIKNIKKSNSKYLLTTSFIERRKNEDIKTGSWRPLNLLIAPFNFPKPITTINEGWSEKEYKDRTLLLWKIIDL
ncbi:MAG: hypothetical protein ACE5DL_00095 [Nitrosopumilaceae archaeon]